MKITIVTSRFPYPLEKGDKLRIYNIAKGLNKNHQVSLISLSKSELKASYIKVFDDLNIGVTNYVLPLYKRVWNTFTLSTQSFPLQIAYFFDRKIKAKIQAEIQHNSPDLIITHLPRCAEYTRELEIPNLLDYMDAFSAGYQKIGELKSGLKSYIYKRESKLLKKYEEDISEDFNAKTIISAQDKILLSSHVSDLKVLSNGVDFDFFKPDNTQKKFDLLFVGNLGYEPNVQAVHFLIEKILPLLGKRKLSVLIAGARPPKSITNLASNNIKVIPWLDDIREAYRQAKIFVAPLFSGAGQQNKILEAMSMGLPCITTDLVATGLEAKKECLISANDEKGFAASIESLLDDTAKFEQLKKDAFAFVHQKFSWESRIQDLEKIISEVTK